jgi:hypothetical protein
MIRSVVQEVIHHNDFRAMRNRFYILQSRSGSSILFSARDKNIQSFYSYEFWHIVAHVELVHYVIILVHEFGLGLVTLISTNVTR